MTILYFFVIFGFILEVRSQDMYGAQYGNNPLPDEARQRARPMTGFEDPSQGQGSQGEYVSPCPKTWQWACDNMQCIAQVSGWFKHTV